MTDCLLVRRILICTGPIVYWQECGLDGLGLDEIKSKLDSVDEVSESYGSKLDLLYADESVDRNWHIGRVKYLVNHKDDEPISIESICSGGSITDEILIDDGNHRLFAAAIRGDEYISGGFGGYDSINNWLKGKRKKHPAGLDEKQNLSYFESEVLNNLYKGIF